MSDNVRMKYPALLIKRFGTASAFAQAASEHPLAPIKLNTGQRRLLAQDAVYMWKQRDFVPHMWQPAVAAMMEEFPCEQSVNGAAE